MERYALIKKRESISHGSVAHPGQISECLIFYFKTLFLTDVFQSVLNGIYRDPVKIISLAPGQDSGKDLLWICRCEYEDHIFRRLFQRLKKRIKSLRRDHMRLVYDVDLVPADSRRIRYFLDNGTHILNAVV